MLQELVDAGHELGWHGAKHLNAIYYLEEFHLNTYIKTEIEPFFLATEKFGFKFPTMAMPFGASTELLNDSLLQYFSKVRLYFDGEAKDFSTNIKESSNYGNCNVLVSQSIDRPYMLLEDISAQMDKTAENGMYIFLSSHRIKEVCESGICISQRHLEYVLDYAQKIGLEPVGLSQVKGKFID